MEITTLRDLFQEQVQDLSSAEDQITDGLARMIEAANDPDLRAALQQHRNETEKQRERLGEIARDMGFALAGHACEGVASILAEGSRLVERDVEADDVRDAAIIAAAQRVEHYEIAVYGTARTYARMLGEERVASLLEASLDEEKQADAKLTRIAEAHVNRRAMSHRD